MIVEALRRALPIIEKHRLLSDPSRERMGNTAALDEDREKEQMGFVSVSRVLSFQPAYLHSRVDGLEYILKS